MHITVEENITRLKRAFHHQFCVVVDGVELGRAAHPLPVQIDSHQRAPVIADNDSIRVLHGNNLEDKSVAQKLGLLRITNQKLDHAIHHPRGVRFARVHS